ncbi:spoIIIJ-associated protein [Bacillus oleivorans]|uniref:RNA-binding protein KhpB n=1 Tax=Bacillus oleivorans TaxID=1448271 RepID=A0A285CGG6_9BACI|nr:RNA-binding cell elongation regulator Jag/EloR [Bacillus oleivorans]SNX66702.1 spoIIIJ-associated protein [Bacillus oleivorans]
MKQTTATGQSVEEAVQSALAELNITMEKAEITVIDEGKKGLLGLFGSRPAVVKVKVKEDPVQDSINYLNAVTEKMGVHIDIEVSQNGRNLELTMNSDKSGLLIGKRGQTLNALQYLTQLVANHSSDQYVTVILDTENYREKRNQTLIQLADRLAYKAIQTKKEVVLEPMPSYERKVIHTALSNNSKVRTFSSGTEPNRHIVIAPEL